jgi:hypothetical protein
MGQNNFKNNFKAFICLYFLVAQAVSRPSTTTPLIHGPPQANASDPFKISNENENY